MAAVNSPRYGANYTVHGSHVPTMVAVNSPRYRTMVAVNSPRYHVANYGGCKQSYGGYHVPTMVL